MTHLFLGKAAKLPTSEISTNSQFPTASWYVQLLRHEGKCKSEGLSCNIDMALKPSSLSLTIWTTVLRYVRKLWVDYSKTIDNPFPTSLSISKLINIGLKGAIH